MNKKQRTQNRANARDLRYLAQQRERENMVCSMCGKPGAHWVQTKRTTLEDIVLGKPTGFYSCVG